MEIIHKSTGVKIDTDKIDGLVVIHKHIESDINKSIEKEIYQYDSKEIKSLIKLKDVWDITPDSIDLTTDELKLILSAQFYDKTEEVNKMKNKIYELLMKRNLYRR